MRGFEEILDLTSIFASILCRAPPDFAPLLSHRFPPNFGRVFGHPSAENDGKGAARRLATAEEPVLYSGQRVGHRSEDGDA